MKVFLRKFEMLGKLVFVVLVLVILYECRNDFPAIIVALLMLTQSLFGWYNAGGRSDIYRY